MATEPISATSLPPRLGVPHAQPPHVVGYTLIEITVVLAIMAIFASLAPLALNRLLPQRRLDVTAQQLVTDLRLAQARSAWSRQPIDLALDGNDRLTMVASAGTQGREAVRPLRHGTRMTDGNGKPESSFWVYPDGSVDGGRIELAEQGYRAVVVVSDLTGRAWVESKGQQREP
jgi:type II secretion system protein H